MFTDPRQAVQARAAIAGPRTSGRRGRGSRARARAVRWGAAAAGRARIAHLVVVQETLGDVLPLLETVDQLVVGPAEADCG